MRGGKKWRSSNGVREEDLRLDKRLPMSIEIDERDGNYYFVYYDVPESQSGAKNAVKDESRSGREKREAKAQKDKFMQKHAGSGVVI